ncbi:MAG: Tfx family DNA-binding protein [Desulfurococcaceae archaeon]|jgi:Tfx family DNA-binding protein|nr:Tfx family DNA-binding protein [Desulfurococcaceae archaeon]
MSKRTFGFFTEKEYSVLRLRAQGLTQREIAQILGVSRTTVSILERAALRKVKLAEKTLNIYRELYSRLTFTIKPGVKLAEIPVIILRKADEVNIKLKGDFTYIYSQLRYKVGVKRSVLDREIKVIIYRDGSFEILQAESLYTA